MRKYSFEKVKDLFIVGDCHGKLENAFNQISPCLYIKEEDEDKPHPKELERQERNVVRLAAEMGGRMGRPIQPYTFSDSLKKKMKDASKKMVKGNETLYIAAGDTGINANKNKELIERYNRIFSYNNIYFIIIRGNEDDPSMFDGEAINLSNIKAVPDYSVIQTAEKNILCIGGAISMDRAWKINQEKLTSKFPNPKKFYWEDEKPVFNEEAIKDIAKECKIDYVVSHSAPSFINVCDNTANWAKKDENLSNDMSNERLVMDKVFETLRDCGSQPYYWAFNHFATDLLEKRSNTIFRSLPHGMSNVFADISTIDFENQKKEILSKYKKMAQKGQDPFTINNVRNDGFVEVQMDNNGELREEEPAAEEEYYDEENDAREEAHEAHEDAFDAAFEEALMRNERERRENRDGEVREAAAGRPLRYYGFGNDAHGIAWQTPGEPIIQYNMDELRAELDRYTNAATTRATVTTTLTNGTTVQE